MGIDWGEHMGTWGTHSDDPWVSFGNFYFFRMRYFPNPWILYGLQIKE
jgi:hypothetical protein